MIYDLNYYELPDLSKSKLLRGKKKKQRWRDVIFEEFQE